MLNRFKSVSHNYWVIITNVQSNLAKGHIADLSLCMAANGFTWSSWPPSTTWFFEPSRLSSPNSISIGSSIFTQHISVITDRHTDTQTTLCATSVATGHTYVLQLGSNSRMAQCGRTVHGILVNTCHTWEMSIALIIRRYSYATFTLLTLHCLWVTRPTNGENFFQLSTKVISRWIHCNPWVTQEKKTR